MHFADEFVELILSGAKQATTRWYPAGNTPRLLQPGVLMNCLVGKKFTSIFAQARVTKIEKRTFDSIDDALARVETYDSADELKAVLMRFLDYQRRRVRRCPF